MVSTMSLSTGVCHRSLDPLLSGVGCGVGPMIPVRVDVGIGGNYHGVYVSGSLIPNRTDRTTVVMITGSW